jgi:hypothetical protein
MLVPVVVDVLDALSEIVVAVVLELLPELTLVPAPQPVQYIAMRIREPSAIAQRGERTFI